MAALRDGGRWIVPPLDTVYHPAAFKSVCVGLRARVLVLQPLTHSLTRAFTCCICTLKTDTVLLFIFVLLPPFFPALAPTAVFL